MYLQKNVALTIIAMVIAQCWSMEYSEPTRPNIVIIVCDDLGWNDVSFHGSPQIPTPNIDAMAADGLVLENYYVQPVCTPSRSALMSGYYPIHTGLQHSVITASSTKVLPLNFTIMPQYLKKLGYSTHAFGKWHLGNYKKEYTPTFRGFDSFFGSYEATGDYYDQTYLEGPYWGFDLHDNFVTAFNESGQYSTELLTKKALDKIRDHDTSNPLFLYLAHKAVHFGNIYGSLASPVEYTRMLPHIRNVNRRLFAGMMTAVDKSTGQIFEELAQKQMLNNSIILFTTDNGGDAFGVLAPRLQNISSNWPLRGGKFSLFEGGVRGVGVLWSSRLPSKKDPYNPFRVRRQLLHITDLLPTLYHAAGGDVKDLGDIDGFDQWDSLIKDEPSQREEILLNIDNEIGEAGIRSGNYKLYQGAPNQYANWFNPSGRDNLSLANLKRLPILVKQSAVARSLRKIDRHFSVSQSNFYTALNVTCGPRPPVTTAPIYLFDVVKDPCEYNNIVSEKPEIVKSLMEKIKEYNLTINNFPAKYNVAASDPDLHNFVWTTWGDLPPYACST